MRRSAGSRRHQWSISTARWRSPWPRGRPQRCPSWTSCWPPEPCRVAPAAERARGTAHPFWAHRRGARRTGARRGVVRQRARAGGTTAQAHGHREPRVTSMRCRLPLEDGEPEGVVVPPKLEATLYRILQQLPGVHFENDTDLAGRHGLGFWNLTEGYIKYEIVIDPTTYHYMGSKGSGGHGPRGHGRPCPNAHQGGPGAELAGRHCSATRSCSTPANSREKEPRWRRPPRRRPAPARLGHGVLKLRSFAGPVKCPVSAARDLRRSARYTVSDLNSVVNALVVTEIWRPHMTVKGG
jgi:hypothetical protein